MKEAGRFEHAEIGRERISGTLAVEARQERVVVMRGAATAAFRIAPHQGRQFSSVVY